MASLDTGSLTFAVLPNLDQEAVKRITAKIDEMARSRDINLNLNASKLDVELKKAQLEVSKLAGDKEVTFKAKADLISAKLASAEMASAAGAGGDDASASFGSRFSDGIKKYARTGGLWENVIAAGITAFPALAAVAGVAGAVALGGAFVGAVALLDPKVKAAGASLGKSLGTEFITGTKASGFDTALITSFGSLKTNLAGPIESIADTLGKVFLPAIKPVTDGIITFADWLSINLPGALKTAQSWLGKIDWKGIGGDVKTLGTDLAQIVVPAFQGWESVMGPVVKALAGILLPVLDFLARNPDLVKAIAATVAVMKLWGLTNAILAVGLPVLDAAIVLATGGIDGLKAAVIGFEESNPFGWIALAIVGIILLGVTIVKYHKQIWAFMVKTWDDIAVLVPGVWDTISSYTVRSWDSISKYLKDAWGGIENVFTGAFKDITSWVTTAWSTVYSNTSRTWSTIANFFSQTWDGLKTTASDAVNWVRARLSNTWDDIKTDASRAWGAIATGIGNAFNTVKKLVETPVNFVINDIINKVIGGINSVFSLHIKTIPQLAMAAGGKVPGWDNGDRVPAMLEGGEAVVPKRLASSKVFKNWAGANGIPGFAAGGIPSMTRGQALGDTPVKSGPDLLSALSGLVKLIREGTADAIAASLNGLISVIPGSGLPVDVAKGLAHDAVNGLTSVISGQQAKAAATGTGPAGGTTGTDMANGQELYQYLLKYLFGGVKVAAAGATASIWGESGWDPEASGTGGRGLIGWTPASSISNADFTGGMRTQLPAILRFVNNSGDGNVIQNMKTAVSVNEAAEMWGKGVERYGIDDVHPEGVRLATSFMAARGGLVPSGVFDTGGTLAPGPNLAYNLTGAPERLNRQGGGSSGGVTTLEVVSGGESEFEQFMLTAIRKWVRVKGGRGPGSVQRALGRN